MKRLATLFIPLFLAAPAARADLLLSVGNATLNPGGTGTIDVRIARDPATPTPNTISLFSLTLVLTPVTPGGQLVFTSQQELHLTDPDFVFAGGFQNNLVVPPPPSGTFPANTFLSAVESTSPTGVSVPVSGSDDLLIRANLAAPGRAGGGTFRVSVDAATTQFFDLATGSLVPFSVAPGGGLVTLGPGAVDVPEPGTLALFAVALLGAAARRRRRT